MILKDKTAENFDIKFSKIKFWVESQILLKYIKNTSLSFPVFVMNHLILIWVGFLGVRFEVLLPSYLKLVTIMLENSNLARKYTHICSFRKYTF